MAQRCIILLASLLLGISAGANSAAAEKKYDPGASDTEIKIGNIMPYSGPLSAYALIGRTEAAFFKKLNDEGGINGRKINFISYDDAFSPPKTVEQARKLVESDEVLLIFQSLGTPTNNAIQKYLDIKRVPQLFVATGATKFGDPKNFPWTMGWQPTYQTEGRIYARYILENLPQGKIGILYQNDDSGRDYIKGLKDGLGADAAKRMIVAEIPYDPAEPTVDSQVVTLKTSGADIFFDEASPKFAAQAIRKAAEIGWKPTLFLASISNSVGSVLKPAGLENSKGLLSTNYIKDPTDPTWKDDPAIKEWAAFMDKYFPDGDKTSTFSVYGYATAQTMVQVLKQCGDELTRENVMKQAANLRNFNSDCCCRASRSIPARPTISRSSRCRCRDSTASTASCSVCRSLARSGRSEGRPGPAAALLTERGRHVVVGVAVVRLAGAARDQHFRGAGLRGIGVEALAVLIALALAELVGAQLAVRRAVGHNRTDHASRHHRSRLGEPRQRVTCVRGSILYYILGARVEIVDRFAWLFRGGKILSNSLPISLISPGFSGRAGSPCGAGGCGGACCGGCCCSPSEGCGGAVCGQPA
jgi:branched-chain amino acid transport system substrate-binding protein